MNTKDKIIENSIELFSKKGYTSISIREIALSVGIKGSSIYNHFDSKEDILNSSILRCSNHLLLFFTNELFPIFSDNSLVDNLDQSGFVSFSMNIFKFLLTDNYSVKLQKILTFEKFKNKKALDLFRNIFIDNILNYQKKLFEIMIERNTLVNKNPRNLALELYSPVFLMFYKYDEISLKEEIYLKEHLTNFSENYVRNFS